MRQAACRNNEATEVDRASGRWRLAALALGVGASWLVVLPAVGRFDSVAVRSRLLEARGVDASAKFYSELPGFRPLVFTAGRLRDR